MEQPLLSALYSLISSSALSDLISQLLLYSRVLGNILCRVAGQVGWAESGTKRPADTWFVSAGLVSGFIGFRSFQFSYIINISLIILEFSVNGQDGYQCPDSGHPHFYEEDMIGFGNFGMCVNALTRAILISTLPLWNRLFKPLSGLVSARIFQNILKNSPNKAQKWADGKLYFSSTIFIGIL